MGPVVATPEQLRFVAERPASLARMFYDRVEASPNREAYRFPDADEVWRSVTWAELGERVTTLAAGLIAVGIDPEQRVAIASNTRYEWVVADLAINAAAAATTTVYPSTTADDVAYILADSQSRIVFAEDDAQVKKLLDVRDQLPNVDLVVTFEQSEISDDWVMSLADLEALGAAFLADHPDAVADRVDSIKGDDLATLIYTSGTTGRPKGVRLAHDGWTYEGFAVAAGGFATDDELEYRWLPMSHSFGKVLLSFQIAAGAACAIDGRVPKIIENLALVKPTYMGAAPRIFEKAYGGIVSMMEKEGGAKLALFRWAEKVGLEYSRAVRSGAPVSVTLKAQHALADKLIFSKVRERFGGRIKFFISGAAALSTEVAEWFHAAGMLILEGYGLTETSAGATVNRPDNYKLGTVGLPLPGTDVKIAKDGEVLIKGPNVMRGYHNLPEESASALLRGGWLATGDIGEIDDDGFLRITDRKKDLFKTSGGKYIAPTHIEGIFKGLCPLASQMLVYGNERNFCSALITLDADAVKAWAGRHGMGDAAYADIVTSPQMQAEVERYVEQLNGKLNRWETIKKFKILDQDFAVETGELTPSMKLKRKVVEEHFRDVLEGFYSA